MRGEQESAASKRNSESSRSKRASETRERAKIRRDILFKLNHKQDSQVSVHSLGKERSTEDIVEKIKKEIETTIRTINEKQRNLESKLSIDSKTLNESFLRLPRYKLVSKPPEMRERRTSPWKPRSMKQTWRGTNEDKISNRVSRITDSFSTDDDISALSDNSEMHRFGKTKKTQKRKTNVSSSTKEDEEENSFKEESDSDRTYSATSFSSSSEHEQRSPKSTEDVHLDVGANFLDEDTEESSSESSLEEVVLPLRNNARILKRTDSTQTYIISRDAFRLEKDQMDSLGTVDDESN